MHTLLKLGMGLRTFKLMLNSSQYAPAIIESDSDQPQNKVQLFS